MTPVDSLVEEIVSQASLRPSATALSGATGSLTFAELDRRSAALAARLREAGVGPNFVVGIHMGRSISFIVSALAVMRAGGAYLPLDPADPEARTLAMLHDAGVALALAEAGKNVPAGNDPVRWMAVDAGFSEGNRSSSRRPAAALAPVRPADLAYVIYTSGSTGGPKGVEVEHGSLANLIRWHGQTFEVDPAARACHLARISFDAAVWETWPYLARGASLHLPEASVVAEAPALRDWIVAEAITHCFAPTPLAEQLIALSWPSSTRLRYLLTGADTLHRYPGPELPFRLVNNYGPTECTVVTTSGIVPALGPGDRMPSIGRPVAGASIHVLDGSLRPVPAGTPGELFIGGEGVARGYRHRPALTAERFITLSFAGKGRLYRTGDRVVLQRDGQIAFLGRIDDQIKIRGCRVEPDEIAAALCQHTGIAQCAVAARPSASGELRLAAYLVLRPGAIACSRSLREHVSARLPRYMIPADYVVLDRLPVTANGKVDRQALPAPDAENSLRDPEFAPPRTDTEQTVARILADLLGVAEVDTGANFFELGGHSLLGTQLIVRLRETFELEKLSLRTIFEAQTVSALAAEIEALLNPGADVRQAPVPAPFAGIPGMSGEGAFP